MKVPGITSASTATGYGYLFNYVTGVTYTISNSTIAADTVSGGSSLGVSDSYAFGGGVDDGSPVTTGSGSFEIFPSYDNIGVYSSIIGDNVVNYAITANPGPDIVGGFSLGNDGAGNADGHNLISFVDRSAGTPFPGSGTTGSPAIFLPNANHDLVGSAARALFRPA